ncbi:prefoldin subunit 1 [Aspergillus niger]|nr:prefoldin subunit 1 [Aspergillus niger]
MSIPNEALQKLLQEIEVQAITSQQQIGVTKAQITTKQRDIRMLELTSKEIGSLPKDTRVYEGVGKMFVAVPMNTIDKRLSSESGDLKTDIAGLEKKLHYLEMTHKNSRENLEQILKSGGKACHCAGHTPASGGDRMGRHSQNAAREIYARIGILGGSLVCRDAL